MKITFPALITIDCPDVKGDPKDWDLNGIVRDSVERIEDQLFGTVLGFGEQQDFILTDVVPCCQPGNLGIQTEE